LPSKPLPRWLVWLIFGIALVGFIDASYLTVHHYQGAQVLCAVIEGCNSVLGSKWAEMIPGVPTALLGALFYLGMVLAAFQSISSKNNQWLMRYSWMTIVGLVFSGFMVYLQLYVIHAICQYCMLSALTSTILFILGMVVLSLTREKT